MKKVKTKLTAHQENLKAYLQEKVDDSGKLQKEIAADFGGVDPSFVSAMIRCRDPIPVYMIPQWVESVDADAKKLRKLIRLAAVTTAGRRPSVRAAKAVEGLKDDWILVADKAPPSDAAHYRWNGIKAALVPGRLVTRHMPT